MKLPPGFNSTESTKVCNLHKFLYRFQQVSRCWFSKLTISLQAYGFEQCHFDYSLFTYVVGAIQLQSIICVDDLIITRNQPDVVLFFKAYLASCLKMKDLDLLRSSKCI